MERWSVQQRIFCVEQFVLSKSIVSVQREFRRKFGDDRQRGAGPSRKIIGRWVRQWRETGSVEVKFRTRRNTVRSPENIQRVRIALDRSPRRSVRRYSQLLNLSDRSVRRILHHDLHFHPYKLQIVQELIAAHKALGVLCCQQMVYTHADLGGFLITSD
jgi:hypothetical protein